MIIFTYANSLLILGIVWVFITLFSIPLMFFMDVKTFEGIGLTIKGLKRDFVTILISVIVALLFSLSGILLFGFGFLFTFPFWNAVIYSLYKNYYHENEGNLKQIWFIILEKFLNLSNIKNKNDGLSRI